METKAKEFNLTLSITFKDLEDWGYEGVSDFCRQMLKDGMPEDTRVEVSRDGMLCLIVENMAEAAKTVSKDARFAKYRGK